jgi:GH24 family phage-related lysozyme (muramidase)
MNTRVTPAQTERSFEERLRIAEEDVRSAVRRPLTQAQFDALVSLAYNAGPVMPDQCSTKSTRSVRKGPQNAY